jgi:glycosyltransferase involved in cell wall biosynthesis
MNHTNATSVPTPPPDTQPLIACICPTRDRRPYLPVAIRCFLAQDYQPKALIILDDGNDHVDDLIPPGYGITYIQLPPPFRTLGAKINAIAQIAKAPILCNWDDDDWSHPHRLTHQQHALETSHKAMTGFRTIYYWNEITKTAYRWKWGLKTEYACGSSQMFTRDWILAHPAPDITIPVDRKMADAAAKQNQLHSTPADHFLIARYHPLSRWACQFRQCGFPPVHASELPPQFFIDCGYPVPGAKPHAN